LSLCSTVTSFSLVIIDITETKTNQYYFLSGINSFLKIISNDNNFNKQLILHDTLSDCTLFDQMSFKCISLLCAEMTVAKKRKRTKHYKEKNVFQNTKQKWDKDKQ
jgi:hypothetical protein